MENQKTYDQLRTDLTDLKWKFFKSLRRMKKEFDLTHIESGLRIALKEDPAIKRQLSIEENNGLKKASLLRSDETYDHLRSELTRDKVNLFKCLKEMRDIFDLTLIEECYYLALRYDPACENSLPTRKV